VTQMIRRGAAFCAQTSMTGRRNSDTEINQRTSQRAVEVPLSHAITQFLPLLNSSYRYIIQHLSSEA